MRILVRTSRWAIWSRRTGGFALPLAIISVILHRTNAIETQSFHIALSIAVVLGLIGFITGVAAYIRLWGSGDRGWGRASSGIVFGLVFVVPVVFATVLTTQYPQTADVFTDQFDPPELAMFDRAPGQGASDFETLQLAFPNAVNRTYPLNAGEVFELVELMATEMGWERRIRRPPGSLTGIGQLNASVTSFLGWRDEVSIRVQARGEGATVAMRSASGSAVHDLGVNGLRIEKFLLDLDRRVSEIIRDRPST